MEFATKRHPSFPNEREDFNLREYEAALGDPSGRFYRKPIVSRVGTSASNKKLQDSFSSVHFRDEISRDVPPLEARGEQQKYRAPLSDKPGFSSRYLPYTKLSVPCPLLSRPCPRASRQLFSLHSSTRSRITVLLFHSLSQQITIIRRLSPATVVSSPSRPR